jgi:hypothetical protein
VTIKRHQIPIENTGDWVIVLTGFTEVDMNAIDAEGATITLIFHVTDPCDSAYAFPTPVSQTYTHYTGFSSWETEMNWSGFSFGS